jgi:hypothetical protein
MHFWKKKEKEKIRLRCTQNCSENKKKLVAKKVFTFFFHQKQVMKRKKCGKNLNQLRMEKELYTIAIYFYWYKRENDDNSGQILHRK